MKKKISVGTLRQNPTAMLDDVESGATYSVTRHGKEVAQIVPPGSLYELIPPRKPGGANTLALPRIKPSGGIDLAQLLEETRGER